MWNEHIKSYSNWDIYYLYEYAHSLMLHGDGEPLLICYEDEQARFCYVVMKKDIAECDLFKKNLEKNKLFDLETPYGYGGPLSDKMVSESSQHRFMDELKQYCKVNNIVSQFVRFNPLTGNFKLIPEVIETRYMRDTIYIDTTSVEIIWDNFDSKNRNMVRKAMKNDITIKQRSVDAYEKFIPMYTETMKKNNADVYYTFDEKYFDSLKKMTDNACIFFALLNEKIISGAVVYYNKNNMHYHLSGSYIEYKSYPAGNLLLYEAACWGNRHGIRKFHLGGGMSPDDSLFGFKKQFNKTGRLPFHVGRTIFDDKSYQDLVKLRKKINDDFDMDNNFMIQYRA